MKIVTASAVTTFAVTAVISVTLAACGSSAPASAAPKPPANYRTMVPDASAGDSVSSGVRVVLYCSPASGNGTVNGIYVLHDQWTGNYSVSVVKNDPECYS